MMQHIGDGNHIKASVRDSIELVDFMAVKHMIKMVEIKHIAGDNVWQKLFQRRSTASYLQHGERCRIWKTFKLIAIKLAIPQQKVLIGTEARAIAQCDGAVLLLLALSNCDRLHLAARI